MSRKALKSEVAADIRAVINARERQEAEELLAIVVQKYAKMASDLAEWMEKNITERLTVFSFPEDHRRCLRTTKGLERLNREIRCRTRDAVLFPNTASCLRLVTAILMEISEEWQTGRINIRLDNNV